MRWWVAGLVVGLALMTGCGQDPAPVPGAPQVAVDDVEPEPEPEPPPAVVAELISAETRVIGAREANNFRDPFKPEPCLIVRFRVTNRTEDRRVYYSSGFIPELSDDRGNTYRYRGVDDAEVGRKRLDDEPLDPGKSAEDLYVFEKPTIPARSFTVRVPGGNITDKPGVAVPSTHPDMVLTIDAVKVR